MISRTKNFRTIALLPVLVAIFGVAPGHAADSGQAEESAEFGPPNLMKTMKTPFGIAGKDEAAAQIAPELAPIGISGGNSRHLTLSQRLVPTRLYLPGRMILGRSCEFTVKAKPKSWVALAMADKSSGAKAILGHTVKLGSDRKLVALAEVPESGVATLNVETPIQGDLIGQSLYFEAVIWSKPDFSDIEFATPVRYEGQGKDDDNGVMIAAEGDTKKGIKLVPNTSPLSPLMNNAGSSLGTNVGRP